MSNPSELTNKWVPGAWNKYEEPYDNYAFYSLYGWRVNPPNEYPQSTFNTPYDVNMRECSTTCNRSHYKEECLEDCHLRSVSYAVKKDRDRLFKDPSDTSIKEDHLHEIEKYSNVSRSLPSHTSPRFRFYKPDRDLKRFCFYR